jgi:hypothetical protein
MVLICIFWTGIGVHRVRRNDNELPTSCGILIVVNTQKALRIEFCTSTSLQNEQPVEGRINDERPERALRALEGCL